MPQDGSYLAQGTVTADADETLVDTSVQALARLARSMRNKITMIT